MPKWLVCLEKVAQKDFTDLDKSTQIRVADKLSWFSDNFEQTNPIRLSNELAGFSKLRVGDYRIVYEIDSANFKLKIAAIEHRSKVYKKRD